MTLIDLMLTVCLASNASHCRTEHIYMQHHGSEMQCMLGAQRRIAQWIDQHPDFRVVRWECVDPDNVRKI